MPVSPTDVTDYSYASVCELCAESAEVLAATPKSEQHACMRCPLSTGGEFLIKDHRTDPPSVYVMRPQDFSAAPSPVTTTVGDLETFLIASGLCCETSAPAVLNGRSQPLPFAFREQRLREYGVVPGTFVHLVDPADVQKFLAKGGTSSVAVVGGRKHRGVPERVDPPLLALMTSGFSARNSSGTPGDAHRRFDAVDAGGGYGGDSGADMTGSAYGDTDDDTTLTPSNASMHDGDPYDDAAYYDDEPDDGDAGSAADAAGPRRVTLPADSPACSFAPPSTLFAPHLAPRWASTEPTPAGSMLPPGPTDADAEPPAAAADAQPATVPLAAPPGAAASADSAAAADRAAAAPHCSWGGTHIGRVVVTGIDRDVHGRTVVLRDVPAATTHAELRDAIDTFGDPLRVRLRRAPPGTLFTCCHVEFARSASATEMRTNTVVLCGRVVTVRRSLRRIGTARRDSRDAGIVRDDGSVRVPLNYNAVRNIRLVTSEFGLDEAAASTPCVLPAPSGDALTIADDADAAHAGVDGSTWDTFIAQECDERERAARAAMDLSELPHRATYAYVRAWVAAAAAGYRQTRRSDALARAFVAAEEALSWATTALHTCPATEADNVYAAALDFGVTLIALAVAAESPQPELLLALVRAVTGIPADAMHDGAAAASSQPKPLWQVRAARSSRAAAMSAAEANAFLTIAAVVDEVDPPLAQQVLQMLTLRTTARDEHAAAAGAPAAVVRAVEHVRACADAMGLVAAAVFPHEPQQADVATLVLCEGLRVKCVPDLPQLPPLPTAKKEACD